MVPSELTTETDAVTARPEQDINEAGPILKVLIIVPTPSGPDKTRENSGLLHVVLTSPQSCSFRSEAGWQARSGARRALPDCTTVL